MKKLLDYSRVAATIVLVLSILLSVEVIIKKPLWFLWAGNFYLSSKEIFSSICQITILCFLMLIHIRSAKGSALRNPTLIGIVSVGVGICNIFFHSYYLGNIVIGVFAALGLFWSLLSVIKYVNNTLVKVLCMTFSILNIPTYIEFTSLYILFYNILFDEYNIMWSIIQIISSFTLSAFYYAFAKKIK